MFVIIPLLSFYFIFLIFYRKQNKLDSLPCWRSAFLSASIVWAVILTAITEFLSLFTLLKFEWVLGSWILAAFVSAFIYFRFIKKRKLTMPLNKLPKLPPFLIFLISCLVFIVVAVGIIALVAPPNSWDSMNYHMSRVFHWIQNYSVAHYPTHMIRQLIYTPGAEFAVMHLRILGGGDRFVNFVQWFCMLGSIVGVSLIAKQLGADIRGQAFSAVVCATIPMGILQGSTTLTDYAGSFWMVCFVYYLILTLKEGIKRSFVLKAGASLGLALLTKGISYIYAFPFLIWFVFLGFKRFGRNLCKALLIIAGIAIFINLGYYARNFDLYHHPFARLDYLLIDISSTTIPLFISNIVRNIGLQLGTPLEFINEATRGVINGIHTVLGVAPSDPRITLFGPWPSKFFVTFSFYVDTTGNFLHFILIIASITILLIASQRGKQRDLMCYLAALAGAFFIYCFFIKWQPWHVRYHLLFFVLFCPFIAVVLSSYRSKKALNLIGLILILASLPWVFRSESRKLIGRENIFTIGRIEQQFFCKQDIESPYVETIDYIKSKGYSDIGIILGEWDYEYPFIALLQKGNTQTFRLEHVNVDNVSSAKYSRYPFNGFNPDAIISLKSAQNDKIVNKDTVYVKKWSADPVSVFIRR